MNKLISTTIVGGLLGSLVGGVIFFMMEWTDNSTYWIGGKDGTEWLVLALAIGLIFGGIFGALIGLAIALISPSQSGALLIGTAAGMMVAGFISITSTSLDDFIRTIALLSIPAGSFVGLASGFFFNRRYRQDRVNESSSVTEARDAADR